MTLFDGLISFRTFRMVLPIVIVGCDTENLSANWVVLRYIHILLFEIRDEKSTFSGPTWRPTLST